MEVKANISAVSLFLFITVIACLLQSCASSDLSRNAAGGIDLLHNQKGASEIDVSNSYQNTNQATKGAIIGGVTGGVVGGMANGIGVIPGLATGAILGGALGAYIDAHTSLLDRLENRGAKIFILGDQVLITLPSSRLFNARTSNILYSAYSTLDLVAELIGNFVNMSVKIAAYTNATGSERVNRALSQEQASNIQKYLWSRGINTRLLYGVGYGGTNLVDNISLPWDNSWNYRVEITLEKLPV